MRDQPQQRQVLEISGADRVKFLQDMITNDLDAVAKGLVYAALLSPKGKYLFDFFLFEGADCLYLDVKADRAQALAARLNMYKLRADVTIIASDLQVIQGVEAMPKAGFADPRHESLGWRLYSSEQVESVAAGWEALRIAACVPETGVELIPEETYILEAGFERLNGVDFKKGCYVGQEVTARMKHKTELRKGFVTVALEGQAGPGDEITLAGKAVGKLHSVLGNQAIAYLRFDRVGAGMVAGDANVIWERP